MPRLNQILHVEDEPDLREIAAIALGDLGGYSVVSCGDASAAFAALNGDAIPDLFLLDVMMPDMDGPELLSALRQVPGYEATPAIFVTGKTGEKAHQSLRESGAIGVVDKPFDPMTVAQRIQSIWDGHVGLNG